MEVSLNGVLGENVANQQNVGMAQKSVLEHAQTLLLNMVVQNVKETLKIVPHAVMRTAIHRIAVATYVLDI